MEKKCKNLSTRLIGLLTLVWILFIAPATYGQVKPTPPKPVIKMVLMPDTVLRQAAVDILRLERIVVEQDSTISDLRSAIVQKDSAQKASNMMLTEGAFRESVLLAANQAEQEKTSVWKSDALKYKRQRNWCLTGAAAVVALVVLKK